MSTYHPDPLIERALESAVRDHPYYAHALSSLRIVADPNVPTMATSKEWVTHYNPAQAALWTDTERGKVLVHELEHLLRDHAGRCGDRDHSRFNRAADAEINQRLDGLPDGAIYPETIGMPRGRTAEVYYGATADDAKPKPEGGDGDPAEGGEGSGAAGTDPGTAQCGSAAGGPTQPHERNDAANPGKGAKDGGAEARRETAERVLQSAPGRGTEAGDELREWAETTLGIDRASWYRALATAVGHTMAPYGAPTRWVWPGRRDMRDVGGAMLPRWTGERPSCAVVIDTSGSITPYDLDMAIAAGHFVGRMADVTYYRCNSWAERIGTTLPETLRGGGGTDLTVGIALAIAEGAKAVVVITDCETPWPKVQPNVPIIVGANPQSQRVLANPNSPWHPPAWVTVLPVVGS